MVQETTSVLQFSFFILFALLGTVVSIRLRQPYVVGLLIFGMLAGPHVLSLVSDTGLILTFSELGAILLLFAVGIEFSIVRILKSSFWAVFVTAFKMSVLFIIGYEAALYFGLDLTSALFVGAMLSITSTAILFKIVAQKGMQKNKIMPLLFSMLIVEDIAAVAALTFFSNLGGDLSTATYEDKVYSVLISLGFLGAFYLLIRKPAANAIVRLTSTFSEEVMIFVSFSLCLVLSMAAAYFGLSPAIGAFLAGSIVSSLPNSRRIEREIKPLLLMFASLFFLSLGMQIDPLVILANLPFALALTGLFVLVCFLSVYSLLYITGAGSHNALFGASAMVVMGEFSLLIASLAKDEHGPLLIAAGSFGVIATAIISSFLLDRQQKLMEIGHKQMPGALRQGARSLSLYFKGLIRDFSPSGSFWRISNTCWGCMRAKLGRLALIGILMVLARLAIGLMDFTGQLQAELRAAVLIVGAFPIAYFLFGLLKDARPVLDLLSRTIARHRRGAKDESIILRDLAIALGLIFASIVLPEIESVLQLPGIFSFADELLFLFALIFLWDVYRHSRKLGMKKGGNS
ncbi:TPA: cation:proton antiporter, partial [Candidatus Micrarchaeota archaeon]|nr:cation:proton antiporter [Candidatus Micrarchaeota archaeon]